MAEPAGRLPDFLGIGVCRGGTTWLWENLRQHPAVWLSPIKEISYFERCHPIAPDRRAGGKALASSGLAGMLARRLQRFRWRRLGRYLRHSRPAELAWQWRFYRCDLSDRWYRSLFTQAGDRLAGDITPHYSALGDEGVAHVTRLLPEARFILLLRDPIDRDWSSCLNFLARMRRRDPATISDEEFLAHLRDPGTRHRGDYLPMLDRWTRAVPPERLLIEFHDTLVRDPAALYERICRFLGIDTGFRPSGLARRVNASPAHPMPRTVERFLARNHLPALAVLAERFGPPVDTWLARALRLAGTTDGV